MSNPIYLPGFEPDKLKTQLESFFNEIDKDFPDKTIVWSEWNHEKLDLAAVMLCEQLGYEKGSQFLKAYGYSIVPNRAAVEVSKSKHFDVADGFSDHAKEGSRKKIVHQKGKRKFKLFVFIVIILIVFLGVLVTTQSYFISGYLPNLYNLPILNLVNTDARIYSDASELYQAGDYQAAYEKYSSISYSNSQEMALDCIYSLAINNMNNCRWEDAIALLEDIGTDFSNAKIQECRYNLGLKAFNEHRYSDAAEIFKNTDFADSSRYVNDSEFLAALEESIIYRMDNEQEDDLRTVVDTELVLISGLNSKVFANSQLKEKVDDYITGSRNQKYALGLNYIEYQIKWLSGYVQRAEVLNWLYKEYGFMADNARFVSHYISNFERKKVELDELVKIDADVSSQLRGKSSDYVNSTTQSYTYKNNTNFYYGITLYFDAYNSNNEKIGSYYKEEVNIRPHDDVRIEFYYPPEGAYFYLNWEISV